MKRSDALQEFVLAASTLTSMVERRSFAHALSVAELCRRVGNAAGLPPERLRNLIYAALLHDVGEIALSEKILDKKGRLSPRERRTMENHTLVGCQVVHRIPTLETAASLIRWHHENIDGTGYPDALEGDSIPPEAAILHLCDMFDTLRTDRPFRKAMEVRQARQLIREHVGLRYSAPLVDLFFSVVDDVPDVDGNALPNIAGDDQTEMPEDEWMAFAFAISMVLSDLVAERHPQYKGYAVQVSMFASALGKELKLSPRDLFVLELAALLHEVGMAAIPSEILGHRRKLTAAEMKEIHKHPVYSYEVTHQLRSLSEVAEVVRSHHERYDGKGYPDGLKGDRIPYLSRILSVCAAFEAMISNRPHRRAMSPSEALDTLLGNLGKQFDPHLRESLKALVARRV